MYTDKCTQPTEAEFIQSESRVVSAWHPQIRQLLLAVQLSQNSRSVLNFHRSALHISDKPHRLVKNNWFNSTYFLPMIAKDTTSV